jgi:hypothetical protein
MGDADPRNRRRSQRVLLQVAVLMRATLPDGKSAQVQAFTLAVNAHGGLLESPVKLAANQRISLINPGSGKEVAGRVVGVAGSESGMHEVAVEFDCRSPQFWPIAFPPEDWATPEEVKYKRY